jgi:sortase B
MDRRPSRLYKILIVFSVLLLVFGIVLLSAAVFPYIKGRAEYRDILDKSTEIHDLAQEYIQKSPPAATPVPSPKTSAGAAATQTPAPAPAPTKRNMLSGFLEINADAVGFLTVQGTAIEYPVAKSNDNREYEKLTFSGNENPSGAIFMDMANDRTFNDFNTVLYGHNMKDGSMFHDLRYYREKDYFDKNQRIIIVTDETIQTYEVFAVYLAQATYEYRVPNYATESQTQNFIERISDAALYKTDRVVTPADKILTLSTCMYDFEDARMVVHAVLVSVD